MPARRFQRCLQRHFAFWDREQKAPCQSHDLATEIDTDERVSASPDLQPPRKQGHRVRSYLPAVPGPLNRRAESTPTMPTYLLGDATQAVAPAATALFALQSDHPLQPVYPRSDELQP